MFNLQRVRRSAAGVTAAVGLAAGTLLVTASPAGAALRDGVCNAGEFCVFRDLNRLGPVHDWQPNVGSGNLDLDYGNDYYVTASSTKVGGTVSSARNRTSSTYRVYNATGATGTGFTDVSYVVGVNEKNFTVAPVTDNTPRSHRRL